MVAERAAGEEAAAEVVPAVSVVAAAVEAADWTVQATRQQPAVSAAVGGRDIRSRLTAFVSHLEYVHICN